MAVGILESFDSSFPDSTTFEYLRAKSDIFNLNCLEMANSSGCQKYLASTCVQKLLDNEWYGQVSTKPGIKSTLKVKH